MEEQTFTSNERKVETLPYRNIINTHMLVLLRRFLLVSQQFDSIGISVSTPNPTPKKNSNGNTYYRLRDEPFQLQYLFAV